MSQIVDFAHVPTNQAEIHERLENWRRWSRSTGRGGSGMLPMFEGYRNSYWEPARPASAPVDVLDAVEIQKVMPHIPERQRWALVWCYIWPSVPVPRVCLHLGVSKAGLQDLITTGRTMVNNRLTRVEHCA